MTTTAADPDRPDVTIRTVQRADLLDILRIEKAAFPQPWPYAGFERFLDEPGFLVADHAGRSTIASVDDFAVIGFIVADTVPNHGNDIGHIKDIAVHPDYRGDGIATQLLDRALGVLASHGAIQVKLEVRRSNTAAQQLYAGFDFEPHHTVPRYYDDGEDALIYVRDLTDR